MELVVPENGLIIWSLILAAIFIFWIVALINILRNDFKGPNEKLIWIVVVIFVPFLGSVLYFAIGRNNRIKHNQY
jgi:hypothetical protein